MNPFSRSRDLWPLLVLAAAGVVRLSAQEVGGVTGLVISTWDGKPLGGVTIVVRGTTLAGQTDSAGRYELKSVPQGDQVLRFTKGGYASATVTDVRVLPGQTTTVNGNLRPEFFELDEFEVTAEEFNEQTAQIMEERSEASGLLDAIGADQFTRVGASDAADIVSKVPGITVADGKFAVIRGLADRYTSTLLNGAEVPSADPYRKAAQLDLFPSSMIDRVNISKTFTPDQPGGFAGGSIDIITKSFPDKPFVSFSGGISYDTAATGNDRFLSGPDSGNDKLGMDDGLRAVPAPLLGDTFPIELERGTVRRRDFPTAAAWTARADEITAVVRSFGDSLFAPTRQAPGPNINAGVSFGSSAPLGAGKLGYFGGLNFSQTARYYDDGVFGRYNNSPIPGQLEFIRSYTRERGAEETQWGAVASLAYELDESHVFGYNLVFTQTGEDVGQIQKGYSVILGSPIALTFKGFTERNLLDHQIKGNHSFEDLLNLKLDWLVSLADTGQNEPSLRYYPMQYFPDPADPDCLDCDITSQGADIPDARIPTIYTRELAEQNQNFRLDFTLPLGDDDENVRNLKTGANVSYSDRTYDDQRLLFDVLGTQRGNIETLPNQKLDLSQFSYRRVGTQNYVFSSPIQRQGNSYLGSQQFLAGYLMGDWTFLSWLRAMAGVRYETTLLEVETPSVTGRIDEQDVLPAAGVTFMLTKNMNIRLAASQTIGRPTYREFAPVAIYDFVADEFVEGNPNLKRAEITNYDLRWEWFPSPGEILSAGVFYKQLTNPIEKRTGGALDPIDITKVSFDNRPDATLYGTELEFRKKLGFLGDWLEHFSFGGNMTLLWASVTVPPVTSGTINVPGYTRDGLFDQSEYIFNTDFGWDHPDLGTAATVTFNIAGERLAVAGVNGPDIYEQPAPQLDLVISQKLGTTWKLRFSARNLLNPKVEKLYGRSGENPTALPYSSYSRGMTFGLSATAEF